MKFHVEHRADNKSQAADELWQLKTGGMVSTALDDDIAEILVALVKQRGEKTNSDHYENLNFFYLLTFW